MRDNVAGQMSRLAGWADDCLLALVTIHRRRTALANCGAREQRSPASPGRLTRAFFTIPAPWVVNRRDDLLVTLSWSPGPRCAYSPVGCWSMPPLGHASGAMHGHVPRGKSHQRDTGIGGELSLPWQVNVVPLNLYRSTYGMALAVDKDTFEQPRKEGQND
jgi:hypothetical protein